MRSPVWSFAALLVCGTLAIIGWRGNQIGERNRSVAKALSYPAARRATAETAVTRPERAPGRMPLAFEKNVGQLDSSVRFLTRGSGYELFFTGDAVTWVANRPLRNRPQPGRGEAIEQPGRHADDGSAAEVLRMRLVGATAAARVNGTAEQAVKTHYFSGNDRSKWRTNVPSFARVQYSHVYPGVDLEYFGHDGQLEYDFILDPGVDPAVIALAFDGIDHMSIDASGDLVLEISRRQIVHKRPLAYQEIAGVRRVVESGYVLTGRDQVGFAVGAHDPTAPLVIDPVISYSTFFGGTGGTFGDQAYAIIADADENIYVAGKAASTNFPVQNGQPTNNDLFVLKMAPDGTPLYVTVIGGNSSDSGEGIAVDGSGQVVVTGYTDSTNFPTVNPIHGDRPFRDGVVAKLDASGVIVYSTYLGGNNAFDYAESVGLDPAGNAYVTGSTQSSDFPVLNAFQPVLKAQDVFVVKIDPTGNLLYGTYLGGTGADGAESIAVDANGSFYVTGSTVSGNFPRVQSGTLKSSNEDVFVTQFAPDGASLVYSRFIGGNSNERAYAITLDGQGGVFVGGRTDSTNFPVAMPLQTDQPGSDAFLTRLAPGGAIQFSTYLAGNGFERVLGLAVRDDRLYVTGQTFSTDFPILDAFQPIKAGASTTADAFVATFDVTLSTLLSSTYLGGTSDEEGRGVAPLPGYNVFVTGWTQSIDFPTVRPVQDTRSNANNVFITRIAPVGVDSVSPDFVVNGGGATITIAGQDFFAGATVQVAGAAATNVTVVNGSTITATLPALSVSGSVDVTVTNPDGGSGTLYHGLLLLNGSGPVADAGPDQSLEATNGSATALLDGTASFDPDGDPISFEWRDASNNLLGTGAVTSVILPFGVHQVTLVATDGHSAPATDTVTVRVVDTIAPAVTVVSPNSGEKIYTGTPTVIEWTASDGGSGLSAFDVYLSTNNGTSYGSTPICANVPATSRTCTWSAPSPATTSARIKVTARDAAGNVRSDTSDNKFSIIAGAAFITITAPTTVVSWGAGSTQQIKWNHNLGASAFTRLEVSVDGGTSWSAIATVRNSSSASGIYNWTLPNVLSSTVRVRASWTHGPVSDESNVDFIIAAPFLQLKTSIAGANWGYGTLRQLSWTTNLGPGDQVSIQLTTDGGATWPITLAGIAASSKATNIPVPTLGSPTASAQVRLLWANAPQGFSGESVSAGLFRIEPPFLTVTAPDGGNLWTIGTTKSINWSNNLGNLEQVLIELSQDDGATYPVVVVPSTQSDGGQSVTVAASWATAAARIRITWLKSPSVTDASNGSFIIQ
jgi:hypothetical protein